MDEELQATGESQRLDFKRQVDPASPGDWCELIKDIVAIANSGGGTILIGLENDGCASGILPTAGQAIDPAHMDDKIFKYTSQHIENLQVICTKKGEQDVLALVVPGVVVPIVFTSPGTYVVPGGKQQTAFGRGTVYFRHGAKSEVGTTDDIRSSFEHQLASRREEWLGNIRRVVEAPAGALVQVIPTAFKEAPPGQSHVGVRLVHDPTATAIPHWNPDDTHPYRLKESVVNLNARLGMSSRITGYDIQCVRRAYVVNSNPNFYYRSRHGSPQYSDAFLDWMAEEVTKDPEFFQKARSLAKSDGERLTTV